MKRAIFLQVLLCVASASGFAAKDKSGDADQAPSMNEMHGTIQGIDFENHVIQLQTDNGFNVQFAYDQTTVCKGIGIPHAVSDLAYKDQVIIRYAGKELLAREIEKRSLQPAIAASSSIAPAN